MTSEWTPTLDELFGPRKRCDMPWQHVTLTDPAAVYAFMKGASLDERLCLGARIVAAGLRGMFKYTLPFYRDPERLTCFHSNKLAAFFATVPDAWTIGAPYMEATVRSERRVVPASEFTIAHADPRCPECQHHVILLMLDTDPVKDWARNKAREMGLFHDAPREQYVSHSHLADAVGGAGVPTREEALTPTYPGKYSGELDVAADDPRELIRASAAPHEFFVGVDPAGGGFSHDALFSFAHNELRTPPIETTHNGPRNVARTTGYRRVPAELQAEDPFAQCECPGSLPYRDHVVVAARVDSPDRPLLHKQ